MEEIWKDIKGYEDRYKISNLGRLFNKKENRIVETFLKTPSGYYIYHISCNRKQKNLYIHKEVAKAFPEICGEYKDGLDAHHIDGNKTNNRADNLILLDRATHMWVHFMENPNMCRGLHPHAIGFKFSDDYKKKISQLRKGKKRGKDNHKSTPVLMLNKETREVLKEFESIHIAGEYLGDVKKQGNIWKCLRGKIPTAYGYKWEYKKEGD